MRTIRYTGRFKRDYKREKAGHRGGTLDRDLNEILRLLVADGPLPRRYFDHPLSGEWRDHRDCHVRPDLILIRVRHLSPGLLSPPCVGSLCLVISNKFHHDLMVQYFVDHIQIGLFNRLGTKVLKRP